MTTQTKIVTSRAPVKEAVKDASMVKQKEMMAKHYDRLTSAHETGDKVAATFVPGNLNELLMCFDLLNNLPEVNAIQNGLRRTSGGAQMTVARNITNASFSVADRVITMSLISSPVGPDAVSEDGTYKVYLRPSESRA